MDRQPIPPESYRAALALRDLTDAAAGPHALQLLVAAVIAALREAWRCPVIVHRASPVVSTEDNYDRLLVPPEAAARDVRYTRYVGRGLVLRTHTTAMLPGLLRSIAGAAYDDVLLACIGLVYRRDRIDRESVGEPHQLDIWRVARRPLGREDLQEMIDVLAAALLPGHDHRAVPASHPYTMDGRELQARNGERWVEIGECGLASPPVLDLAGLPGDRYWGLAMGLGLDRILMVRKGIEDIRLLRSSDERVASQMLDLSPYRPVSNFPSIRRDLSIVVAPGTTPEELGDRVRGALGPEAEAVEAIEVLSDTPGSDLPPAAAARIGIASDQRNLLMRLTIRHPTRTLTASEANGLRDRVYAAVHEGAAAQWAVGALPPPASAARPPGRPRGS